MNIRMLQMPVGGVEDVLVILHDPASIRSEHVTNMSGNPIVAPTLGTVADRASSLFSNHGTMTSAQIREADIEIAELLHEALAPLREEAPWMLHRRDFWEWLALDPFRDYSLRRWCNVDQVVPDSADVPAESKLGRFLMQPANVKSQARHALRRLYILADCSVSCSGTYVELPELLPLDTDIPGAIFERKIGLSPRLALVLSRIATSFVSTPKSGSLPAVPARKKRRDFFKQVNLLVSSVAAESLDAVELDAYFSQIASDIG